MINIAIADDHPLVRDGIKKKLSSEIDFKLVGEASNSSETMEMLEKGLPDILILDLTMPGNSGLDLIKDLIYRYSNLSILVLSIHPPERFAVRSLKAGASGYLCKSSITDELLTAIRKIVIQKRQYITPEVAEQLAAQINSKDGQSMHNSLSDREFEVLCMIASGKNVSVIADKLSLSPHTIHTYRSRIKKKMNVNSNVDMTRYALENDLII
jgi:DNA-binding NarL/FixJ family response regulator